MPDGHINVGGVWKALTGLHVNVAGVWKAVQTGHINVGGVWKEFYNAVAYAMSGQSGINDTDLAPSGTATIGVRVNADGTVDKLVDTTYTQIDSVTDYIIPNGADKTDVRFRCTDNNTNLTGGTTGSWLSAPHTWHLAQVGTGTSLLDIDIEISIDAGTSTHDTGSYTGVAAVEF